jgi:isocitrate dehydrogenase (NAD+)
MSHDVTLVPGDTTGPEIFARIKPLLADMGVDISWDEPVNGATLTGLLASARRSKCVLMGFERGRRDSGELPPVVVLRKELGVFANLRPIRSLPGIPSRFSGVDLLVVRETTEDIYAHLEHESIPGVFESLKVTTAAACERIARYAFESARKYDRKRITIVHKANIMKLSDGMFLRVATRVSEEYPDIQTDECIVDALCMKLILDPTRFDVLLAGNLFGDIVSDLCTGLVGGIGNAPSINVTNDGGALFTVGHGDPVELAGTGHGNPLTLLLPTVHMLRWLGEIDAAATLQLAISTVLINGTSPSNTDISAFFVALAKAVRSEPQ